ncbi:MAG TPA: ParB N-terminal domain-containing protein [Anaeromyxobacteraceae bacterium]|nr:ParB N-terminal domain-containing protein [Anaeromyxobacteraceae bacterium]
MSEQTLLFAEGPIAGERRDVPLDLIASTDHVDLRASLLRNLQSTGIMLQNVVLTEREGGYRIDAGKHRIRCARELGWKAVPALVLPPGTSDDVAKAIAMSENLTRERNIVDELEAAERLLKVPGITLRDIGEQLGVDGKRLKKLLRLTGLVEDLRFRLATGLMAPGVAFKAARLPKRKQQQLAREQQASITAAQVRELAREPEPVPEGLIDISQRPGARARQLLALARNELSAAGPGYDEFAGDLTMILEQLVLLDADIPSSGDVAEDRMVVSTFSPEAL